MQFLKIITTMHRCVGRVHTFVWIVRHFRVKTQTTYLSKDSYTTLCEYIDLFIKIFLNDFIIVTDLFTHIEKCNKCFHKCKEFNISFNPKKCAFMVYFGTISRFIVFKEVKQIPNLKKIEVMFKMPIPTTPEKIQVFNGMAQFYKCFIIFFGFIIVFITKNLKKFEVFECKVECQTIWEDIKN